MNDAQNHPFRTARPCMPRFCRGHVRVINEDGLHLRAASQFVELAQQFRAEIQVFCNDGMANGKSILDLTLLAAGCGSMLELEASGADATVAAVALCELVGHGFHVDGEGPEADLAG